AHIAPGSVTTVVYQYRPGNRAEPKVLGRKLPGSTPPMATDLPSPDTPSVAAMFRALAAGSASQPLAFKISKAGDRFLAVDCNTPDQAEKGTHHVFGPGGGEISSNTHEGVDKHVLLGHSSTPVNEDAYGFMVDAQGRPVLIVADGVGYYGHGDLASQLAVEG